MPNEIKLKFARPVVPEMSQRYFSRRHQCVQAAAPCQEHSAWPCRLSSLRGATRHNSRVSLEDDPPPCVMLPCIYRSVHSRVRQAVVCFPVRMLLAASRRVFSPAIQTGWYGARACLHSSSEVLFHRRPLARSTYGRHFTVFRVSRRDGATNGPLYGLEPAKPPVKHAPL